MFGIPGKSPVTITSAAEAQIARLMAKGGTQGLRIGVKKGGCAGMEYTMDYVTEIDPHDEVVEQNDARVMIAPMAQMFLTRSMHRRFCATSVFILRRLGES